MPVAASVFGARRTKLHEKHHYSCPGTSPEVVTQTGASPPQVALTMYGV